MNASRLKEIDVLRGIGVVLMIPYHLLVDIHYLVAKLPISDLGWRLGSTVIGSIFLFTMGISAWIGTRNLDRPTAWKKLSVQAFQISLWAILVTAASLIFSPGAPVYFGILHCIAAANVLAFLFLNAGILNLILGVGLFVLGTLLRFYPVPWTSLLWLFKTKPIPMGDHYPLVPWLGVVLLGIFVGSRLYANPVPRFLKDEAGESISTRSLKWLGQHSLGIYLIHQPAILVILFTLGFATPQKF